MNLFEANLGVKKVKSGWILENLGIGSNNIDTLGSPPSSKLNIPRHSAHSFVLGYIYSSLLLCYQLCSLNCGSINPSTISGVCGDVAIAFSVSLGSKRPK